MIKGKQGGLVSKDMAPDENIAHSRNSCESRYLGSCRFLSRANLLLPVLTLCWLGIVLLGGVDWADGVDFLGFLLIPLLWPLSIVVWVVLRLLALVLHQPSEDSASPTRPNYGGRIIFYSTVLCVCVVTLGPYAFAMGAMMILGG